MTADQLKAWRARLGLGEHGFARYLGTSVHTLRKWENGTRHPDSATLRLFDVLARVESQAPDLHASLIDVGPEPVKPGRPLGTLKRSKGTKAPAGQKNPASGPPYPAATASDAPPAPWVHVAEALPDWMKTSI